MGRPKVNYIGRKIGRLTVLKFLYTKNRLTYWECTCDCGKEVLVSNHVLKHSPEPSCGCRQVELKTKHGLGRTRLYGIWNGMIQRCYNTKRKAYPDYGGRGIIVCDSWRNDFISFKEWAEQHGYSDELSIERINADGNYDPGNCEWITRARQARNKRTTKLDSVSISALYKRMEEAKKTREHERMNEAREELLRRGISERRTI